MEVPKTIYKNNHTYTFIKKCNDKVFLYESELGFKETFTLYDLGLLDNRRIDAKFRKGGWNKIVYVVYDRLLETEKEYNDPQIIANELNTTVNMITRKINKHRWLDNRWFIERRHI